ncbi:MULTISPECIES: hypothetical protein [unclassified Mesorhizobium]|uniref:hypothetical protein n=1 Tax=unclassified Mesorhizobium TaxID=325217 RepID=UPI00112A8FCB|nr:MULTISPECIES: hypothetical protein [unclassified Mesorhizobium]TPJ51769.1 hypothetical protein FJ426_18870 [Mesorhizobium sp. B2-6-4]TPN42391.1 hypothetical protein FJ979_02285 [Mesorhizobium sp. B1-1-6]
MNVDAINNLAGFLENIPSKHNRGFNMGSYTGPTDPDESTNVGFQCNSTACIAGWACLVVGEKGQIRKTARSTKDVPSRYEDFAADLLDLDYRTSKQLFEPMNVGPHVNADVDWDKITPRQAAKVLRHLAKTGEADWSIAL